MKQPSRIRLLASTNNARGDVFTRLVKDLFFALGFDDLRVDVHRSGREVDIEGKHRLEPRRMAAECKAHARKIGGDDLNKFLGVLTRERSRHTEPVAGYFVSLGGFRETAEDQELDTDEEQRLILVDSRRVIEELTRLRVIVEPTEAAERAGRCAEHAGLVGAELQTIELLGLDLGYVWAVFYTHHKARTHFALIHADGSPLAESVAQTVIDADAKVNGKLYTLQYLPPRPQPADRAEIWKTALERYHHWIGEECGFIQLDGLPADTHLSATRLKLEQLFVPLSLKLETQSESEQAGEGSDLGTHPKAMPVGQVLDTHPHLAILAPPGGGKSTLLKRLASAYAFPDRFEEADDGLPQRMWLPLFLRCRELRDRAHRPLLELFAELALFAGMNDEEVAEFKARVHDALRRGEALLLIDGLDEIADEGARALFAKQVRTFTAMFPNAAVVVTSRVAGFRHVAGVLAGVCQQTSLAPFSKPDVLSLCERWHVEVVGDTERVRADAQDLAETIWANERIRALTENPLLLTTLLVVRRYIGELPSRRVELYREAVRVLIRTWNTEGFEPMDLAETHAQLSYVACAMMREGTQRIGHRKLQKLLQQARKELTAELQFSKVSPAEFIDRIEYRSSLLMQVGHERIDDEFQPVFEFRHLTFQEYLAARGFVEEEYPGRDAGQDLVQQLEPYFNDEGWQEVIPLAVALAGRRGEPTVRRLVEIHGELEIQQPSVLMRCLLDEVQIRPETLDTALRAVVSEFKDYDGNLSPAGFSLMSGRFGPRLQELIIDSYDRGAAGWEECVDARKFLAEFLTRDLSEAELFDQLVDDFSRDARTPRITAALRTMRVAFSLPQLLAPKENLRFRPLHEACRRLVLRESHQPLQFAGIWALVWIGAKGLWRPPADPELLARLFELWRDANPKISSFAGWALFSQTLLLRNHASLPDWGDCDEFLVDQWESRASGFIRASGLVALLIGWYRRRPWTDLELADRLAEKMNQGSLRDSELFGVVQLAKALAPEARENLRNNPAIDSSWLQHLREPSD